MRAASIDASNEIHTERLRLIALTLGQLQICLDAPGCLEGELEVALSPNLVSEPVRQASRIKLDKMSVVPAEVHPWYTYWLLVIAGENLGAGLAGFKGEPNGEGEVEIGYGIDSAHRNRGYTTEAVRALIAWALAQPTCRSVVAETRKGNGASGRVLAKVGMRVYRETADMQYWRTQEAWGPGGVVEW
jgi:hypothetical protein